MEIERGTRPTDMPEHVLPDLAPTPRMPAKIEDLGRRNLRAGVWRLADPKISLASMASITLGACLAAKDGSLSSLWLAVTVLGIFAIEIAKNASGEIIDFDSGADLDVAAEDRSPFSGGKRVLVDGLLSRGQTKAIAAAAYLAGIAAGLAIVALRDTRVLWLGLAGVACAFFYHAPPLKLSYRGLGELAVALCYGPLIAVGTYLVQRGDVTTQSVYASLPLGLLIAAFLWINEFPDYQADRGAGKRNLVVLLGRRRARWVFMGIVGAAGVGTFLLPFLGLPRASWLGGIALAPGAIASVILVLYPETTPRIIPAQKLTLLSFLLMALGTGAGALLGG